MLEDSDYDKTLAKFSSWEKAVNGAIRTLKSDFSELSDVVDPYSMALTMVCAY